MSISDTYQQVTDNIIKLLETVDLKDYEAPFSKLAAQGMPLNPTTGNLYRGINILTLWFTQQDKSYASNRWATFKQWKGIGAHVRRKEKSTTIVFYKTLTKTDTDEAGEEYTEFIPMMRTFRVFNSSQVDGYEDDQAKEQRPDLVKRIALVDEFCKNTGADIRSSGDQAYYDPVRDLINMPRTEAFNNTASADATEHHYSTLLHELSHWTGARHRLNRTQGDGYSFKEAYALEELVAELSAAYLCAQLGVTQGSRVDHAMYIKSWLKALKNDNKFIFKAAAQAAKASDYLNELQPEVQ